METALIAILICWLLGWVAYCIGVSVGVNWAATWASLSSYAWWLAALVPVGLAAWAARRHLQSRPAFKPGQHVVYVKQKFTLHPGPRAEKVRPAAHGDGYSYFVRKPWTVVDIFGDRVEVVTNGGKRHLVRTDDPDLHPAGPLESVVLRLRWHKRFPAVAS